MSVKPFGRTRVYAHDLASPSDLRKAMLGK
jgi:hypothetical protein